jgi:hypothetical protein
MYRLILFSHAYLRWVVLLLALVVVVRSFVGWRGKRPWVKADNALHASLVGFVDLQLLLGLILYFFLSPLTKAFLSSTSEAMKSPLLRFFGMEHAFGMLIAVALFHAGRAMSKKKEGAARHRQVFTMTLIALVVTFLAIPWPGMKYGRPLLRGVESAPAETESGAEATSSAQP